VVELAHQIQRIVEFTRLDPRGLQSNPGAISGGSDRMVIAAEARPNVDIRVPRLRGIRLTWTAPKFQSRRPVDTRWPRIEVTGGLNRPPMETDAPPGELFPVSRPQPMGKGKWE